MNIVLGRWGTLIHVQGGWATEEGVGCDIYHISRQALDKACRKHLKYKENKHIIHADIVAMRFRFSKHNKAERAKSADIHLLDTYVGRRTHGYAEDEELQNPSD